MEIEQNSGNSKIQIINGLTVDGRGLIEDGFVET